MHFDSSRGRRAFDFYRANSAHLLQGICEGDFWDGVVLQLSLTEPIVRHAVLAVSGLLECVASTRPALHLAAQRGLALSEYGKAIRGLRKWSAEGDKSAIPLLVCVLFICIEFLLEHDGASQLHVCQGRNILSGLAESRSPDMRLIKNDLVPIYARLSLASFLFGSRPVPIPNHLTGDTESPPNFTSIEHSRCCLYVLLDQALRFTTKSHPVAYSPFPDIDELNTLAAEQQSLLTRLSDWRNAFAVFAASQKGALPTEQHLLQIYYNASMIWISTALQPLETAYDAHTPAFASIIADASAVLQGFSARSQFPLFTFETELIAPLYWTATKCRHPLLRRAAVGLLMRDELRNRRENMWSGKAAIVIATRVIELEEARDDRDVPARPVAPEFIHDCASLDMSDQLPLEGMQPLSHPPSDIRVPKSQPPTIPRVFFPMLDSTAVFPDEPATSLTSAASTPGAQEDTRPLPILPPSEGVGMHPPYGVAETRRIKNTLIEPREADGVWVRMFRGLEDGERDWHVTREFLPL
ncbi:fungal transcriptional regulatory protein [Purpureocillium lavendulum]|uniref:Fungal transcriptional regulatory protein n=1 Tax=Purpureocillium lavendulum TaxID=1247861 RepID=A0AB34FKW3_9HYPO|nr:fungal transcriptional regulatory protein [Purpureocillium lavendulum]